MSFLCSLGCTYAVTNEEKRPQYSAEMENEMRFYFKRFQDSNDTIYIAQRFEVGPDSIDFVFHALGADAFIFNGAIIVDTFYTQNRMVYVVNGSCSGNATSRSKHDTVGFPITPVIREYCPMLISLKGGHVVHRDNCYEKPKKPIRTIKFKDIEEL